MPTYNEANHRHRCSDSNHDAGYPPQDYYERHAQKAIEMTFKDLKVGDNFVFGPLTRRDTISHGFMTKVSADKWTDGTSGETEQCEPDASVTVISR